MRILSWDDFLSSFKAERPMAATIGVFDGLHRGHLSLIEALLAHGQGRTKAVFTFSRSPKLVLRPDSWQGGLSTLGQKVKGFEALGLDLLVLIDFSGNFSKLAGREFLSLLKERGSLEYLAVGSTFSCGHGLDTKAGDIPPYFSGKGVVAEVILPLLRDGEPVSSSRIRKALLEGRLDEAADMLGRPYEIDLSSLEGSSVDSGLAIGLPGGLVLPPAGIYEVEAIGKDRRAMVRLGVTDQGLEFPPGLGFRVERVAFVKLTQE